MTIYTPKQLRQYIGNDLGAFTVIDVIESIEYKTNLMLIECKKCRARKKILPSKVINKTINNCNKCGFTFKGSLMVVSEANKSIGRIRNTYNNMLKKCYDKNYPAYHKYGGSNIKVDKRSWGTVGQFIQWAINNNYTPSSKMYRIDETLDFSPSNCYWSNSDVRDGTVRKVIKDLENILKVMDGDIKILSRMTSQTNLKDRIAWLRREITELLGEQNG